jgi:hypothetical protein
MCQFNDIGLLTIFPDFRVLQMLQCTGVLRYNRCLGDAVDARRTLEWGKTDDGGSGPQNVIFSNDPKIIFEWFNLLN